MRVFLALFGPGRRQAGRVVAIGIATGNGLQPLPQQLFQLMNYFPGLPAVSQTLRQPGTQTQTLVQRLQ